MSRFLLAKVFLASSLAMLTPPEHEQNACVRQISIWHVGVSDKPLFGLIFSNQAVRIDINHDMGQTVVVLSEREFDTVEKVVVTFDHSVLSEVKEGEYGTFEVTAHDSCKLVAKSAYNRADSKILLKLLLNKTAQFKPEEARTIRGSISELLYQL